MQLLPRFVRSQTYLCSSLNVPKLFITFSPSPSLSAHRAFLAQHIAMTTSTRSSSVAELCDNYERIDLSMFLPCADLEFPDASGCYSEENRTFETYVREPDRSLIDEDLLPDDASRGSYDLDPGPLEVIAARQKACPLCHFITTMFKESYKREFRTFQLPWVMRALAGSICNVTTFG